jgi:signal transduction histidine kinase
MSSGRAERPPRTLGLRLALWHALLFTAGALLLGILAYALLASSLRQRDHDAIRATLDRYVGEYRRFGLAGLQAAIASDRVAGRHERLFVRVIGRDREAVFLNVPSDWQGADVDRLGRAGPTDEAGWLRLPASDAKAELEVASVRLPDGTLFQIGKSSEARAELLARFRDIAALLLGTTVVIGVAGGALLTWWALRPVRELAATLRRIVDTGEMSTRVPVRGSGDPLDQMGRLFNGMLDRIEALIGGLEGSLDNVAHDLRTPLARLRASAETALREGGDLRAAREALADCLEESERVHETLTALLDISEAEHGAMRLRREQVGVAALLRDAAGLYEELAEEKRVRLEVEAPEGLWVNGDRPRLRQAVANLLDNAVKYTPAGGRVVATARAVPGGLAIEVTDDGPGIPEDEQARIWDRLYRGDRARSERGLGLGLSLVRAMVQAHGGTVTVRSAPGRGSTFRIELPEPAASITHL